MIQDPTISDSRLNGVKEAGGEGGIRTHDTVAGTAVFKTAAFSRSATSPGPIVRLGIRARRVGCSRRGLVARRPLMTTRNLLGIAIASVAFARAAAAQPTYDVYAVRFGVIPQFGIANLVAGADREKKLDLPVMVWVLKGPEGRVVLVDSGF